MPVPCYDATYPINTLTFDSLHNEIGLNCNNVHSICATYFKGILAYNGTSFHALDIGFQTNQPNNLNANRIAQACVPFYGKTLYGGTFESVGSQTLFAPSMALWDGTSWDTLPVRAFNYYAGHSLLAGNFLWDNGKLWIAGQFDSISGFPTQNLATFDGYNYAPVNLPVDINIGVGRMIRYKDGIYIAGLFYDNPFSNNTRLLKYNDNSTWSTVGNGIQGSFAALSDMAIYNDTLYLAGAFSKADGNVANHIMKWDGTQLHDAGFGNFYDWGGINKLLKFKNRLYAFGKFSHVNNQPAFGVAYYEHNKWTICKDSIPWGIIGAEILNGEVYMAGGFPSINGDPRIKFFAKLRCPDFDVYCPYADPHESLPPSIYPNPAHIEFNIIIEDQFRYNSTITVHNKLGQLILKNTIDDYHLQISCDGWASGIYLITLQNSSDRKTFKVFKE